MSFWLSQLGGLAKQLAEELLQSELTALTLWISPLAGDVSSQPKVSRGPRFSGGQNIAKKKDVMIFFEESICVEPLQPKAKMGLKIYRALKVHRPPLFASPQQSACARSPARHRGLQQAPPWERPLGCPCKILQG